MNSRLLIAIALAAGCATTTFAGPSSSASVNRRRLADCMTREMAASRTLSYYAAQALCEDHLKAQERLSPPAGLEAQNEKPITHDPATTGVGR